MRSFYLTFTSDDVDKMRIFGALLDAGMESFVITEQLDCGNISEDDDVSYSEYMTKSTIAENATVAKKIELLEE